MAQSAISSKTLPAIPLQPTAADKSRTTAKPSVDHLMDAPLEQLVEELHITLDVSSITDPTFTGYVIASRDGVVVSMPAGRSELEHDCIARYLIASAFEVDGLPPLPEPFEVTELTGGAV